MHSACPHDQGGVPTAIAVGRPELNLFENERVSPRLVRIETQEIEAGPLLEVIGDGSEVARLGLLVPDACEGMNRENLNFMPTGVQGRPEASLRKHRTGADQTQ